MKGGMGEITKRFAEAARREGARIDVSRGVRRLLLRRRNGTLEVAGAELKDGSIV